MPEVSGTVYEYGSERRIEHASVKATSQDKFEIATTDDDGDFKFKDLKPGKWKLVALHEKSFPSKPKELELMENTTGIRIDLFRLSGSEDAKLGRNLFIGLLVALGVLVAAYVGLHLAFPREPEPLSATLPTLIAQAEEQAADAEKVSESESLMATVDGIKSGVETALDKNTDLEAADREIVNEVAKAVEAAAKADQKAELLGHLATLQRLVETPSDAEVGPWIRDPWRFLEILSWGLAGILVTKIFRIGWYLRSQKFYREGFVMHISHLVTTPLLVLVAVLLLSLVTLNITLAGGNELTVDLSEPSIMVAVSFLLGTIPWPLWNFIQATAERFAGGMG